MSVNHRNPFVFHVTDKLPFVFLFFVYLVDFIYCARLFAIQVHWYPHQLGLLEGKVRSQSNPNRLLKKTKRTQQTNNIVNQQFPFFYSSFCIFVRFLFRGGVVLQSNNENRKENKPKVETMSCSHVVQAKRDSAAQKKKEGRAGTEVGYAIGRMCKS